MLMIPNFKNFRVGDVVRCVVKGVGERLVEGEIVYIHPTNGWMTVRVTTAYTRTKKRESGKVIWAYMPYKLHETYMASMWFDEAFRCSAVTPTKDIKNCWAEVRASDSDARAS